jgi:transcriptional regulator with XRE-family HTH domain
MASSVVGMLRAILTADTAEFDDAMKRSGEAAKTFGRTVQAGFQQLGDGLTASITKMAAAFSVSHLAEGAISSLVDFGKSAFTTSGQLVDLSQKLGVSTDAIQKYSYVAGQSGTNVEAFGQAIFKLGVTMAEGGTKADAALKDLGLTSDRLRSLKPEEQFDLVARALEKVTDVQERNRIGVALMGKGYAEIAASVATYSSTVSQANVVDADRVKALDDAAKAYDRAKTAITSGFTQAIGGLVLSYDQLHKSGVSYTEMLFSMNPAQVGITAALTSSARAQKELNDQWERGANMRRWGAYHDIDLPKAATPMDPRTAVGIARQEILALTEETKQKIAADLQLGAGMDAIAAKYKLTAEAAKIYQSFTAELEKAEHDHAAELKKAGDAAEAYQKQIESVGRAMSVGGVTDAIHLLGLELQQAEKSGGLSRESLEKYGKEIDTWLTQGYAVDAEMSKIHYQWVLLHEATDTAAENMKAIVNVSPNLVGALEAEGVALQKADDAAKSLAANYGYFSELAAKGGSKLMGEISGVGTVAGGIGKAPALSFGMTLATSLATQLPASMTRAFEGGGNVAKSLGSTVGNTVASGVTSSLTKKIAPALGKIFGGGAGLATSIAAGVGTMGISVGVQAAIAGATALVKHHQNATVKDRQDFATQLGFGDLGALYADLSKVNEAGAKLADVGAHVIGKQDTAANEKWMADVQKFYADVAQKQKDLADNIGKLGPALEAFGGSAPKSLQPMIDSLLKSTGLSADMKAQLEGMKKDPSWQTLQQHAEDLGVSLSALGPAFESAKITDIAQGYARDLQMFADSGADVPEVLRGMSDELSTMYQDAAKNGVALPDTLKPYMEQLVRMGLLVDENGDKVDDLNKVTFKTIEDKALKDVVDILTQIKDLLADQLPQAAEEGATAMQGVFHRHPITIPVTYETPDGAPAPGFARPAPPPQVGLQGGTHGAYVDWGSGTPVTLHGRERVMPEGEAVGGGGAPIEITVISQLDGRQVARNQVRWLPRELTLAGV